MVIIMVVFIQENHYYQGIPFEIIRGQLPGVPVKPDPTAALNLACEMNLTPDDFLYVGDTAVDMTCARSAGMFPVGALWGFRTREELLENGAEALLEKPDDLLTLLTNM